MIEKLKVYVYIVQDHDLVVFEQPNSPEAGIQVPGGTVEAGENLAESALREAFEETGLADLSIVKYLGEQICDIRPYGKNERHHRHYYLLSCPHIIPSRWNHFEQYPSEAPPNPDPILFTLYRAPLAHLPRLSADFDAFISEIMP